MLKCIAVVFVLALGLASTALADHEPGHHVLQSRFDPSAGPNEYLVQFPPQLGGSTIVMPIVGGTFHLDVDEEAGTATLAAWHQDISPIDIYGMSTGRIAITMDEGAGSVGTYDPVTKEFSVTATFLITFDDTQLSSVGFVSPVALVGTERGRINGSGSIGTVSMYLEGEGSVAGAVFTYTCRTTARFEYLLEENQAQTADVNHDRRIDIADAVTMLNGLFLGIPMECRLAANVNSDELVDLADPVFLLAHLYQGGPAPSAAPVACDPESGG